MFFENCILRLKRFMDFLPYSKSVSWAAEMRLFFFIYISLLLS
jgi:hypothetical protein